MVRFFMLNRIPILAETGDEDIRIPFLEGVAEYFTSGKFLRTLVVIAIAVIIWVILSVISKRYLSKTTRSTLIERNANFIMTCIKIVLTFTLLIVVLQVNGINVTSLVAGLGIVSVIVGFAFQDLLSDWIKGIAIVAEHYFNVGDVITIGDVTGRVVKINLKVTQIEDIDTGNIITMDNRLISKATVLNENINLIIPMPYDLPLQDTNDLISDITEGIRNIEGIRSAECKGVKEFEDSRITYFIRMVCEDPFKRLLMMRYANNVVREKYEEKGITIPYNQLDVHIKEQ